MAALSKFLPFVLPHVPACPDITAEQAILSSCIEFCVQTLLVQELTTASVTAGTQDYTVDVPSGSRLLWVFCSHTTGQRPIWCSYCVLIGIGPSWSGSTSS